MLKERLPRERLAIVGFAAFLVGLAAYVVVKAQRQPAPIVFESAPATAAPAPQEVVVHAAGAVKNPGVLRLASSARVDDAIRAAGGAAQDADLEDINLAAKLLDGTQVYVPHKSKPAEVDALAEPYRGGELAAPYASHPPRASHASRGGKKSAPSSPVSLNTGSREQFESLPGIGPSTAQKILDYRQAHGGFSSIDELMAVKGIGPKKLNAIRAHVRL